MPLIDAPNKLFTFEIVHITQLTELNKIRTKLCERLRDLVLKTSAFYHLIKHFEVTIQFNRITRLVLKYIFKYFEI